MAKKMSKMARAKKEAYSGSMPRGGSISGMAQDSYVLKGARNEQGLPSEFKVYNCAKPEFIDSFVSDTADSMLRAQNDTSRAISKARAKNKMY